MKTKSTSGRKRKTQTDRLDAMLAHPKGATLNQIVATLGVQPHSARAMVSMARKRLGKTIAKGEDGRYRIAASRRRVPTPM